VLVSSRGAPDARRLVLPEHPLRRADVLDPQALGEDRIRLLIEHYGIADLDRGPARILALTRGEPLFARFVCEAVGRHGPAELDRLEKDPPADAEDYFRDQLSRLEEADLGEVSWEGPRCAGRRARRDDRQGAGRGAIGNVLAPTGAPTSRMAGHDAGGSKDDRQAAP
jgi:hypothetical protein